MGTISIPQNELLPKFARVYLPGLCQFPGNLLCQAALEHFFERAIYPEPGGAALAHCS